MDVDMLQHLETFDRTVDSIKHQDEQPGFVFLPDEVHDEKPCKYYILEFVP